MKENGWRIISMFLPTILAILMAVMSFSNRTTTLGATNLEKLVHIEQNVIKLENKVDKLDETKVDKEVFQFIKEELKEIKEVIKETKN